MAHWTPLDSSILASEVSTVLGEVQITLKTYAHAMHKDDDDLGFLAVPRGESADRPRTVPSRPRKNFKARK
jgi:hypothetical protein